MILLGKILVAWIFLSFSLYGVIKSAYWFARRKAFLNGKCQSMFDCYFWYCELKEASLSTRITMNVCCVVMAVFNIVILFLLAMGVL
ncbi:MAG: hypothetical protein IJ039_04555 [Clostridia bacterium]|nr:hypothetical protein [Clostridia bacterium]